MCIQPKYNIRQRIAKLPGVPRDNIYKLCIELSISERTLQNWMDTEKGSRFSIPSDAMLFFSKQFNCNFSELLNG